MGIVLSITVFIILLVRGNLTVGQKIATRWRSWLRERRREPDLFSNYYISCRKLFEQRFRDIPCIICLSDSDTGAILKHLKEEQGSLIVDTYQSSTVETESGERKFDYTIVVLRNKLIVELGHNWCDVFFHVESKQFAYDLVEHLKQFKQAPKKKDFEINVITNTADGLDLKRLAIQPTTLDLGLYYNDDFIEVDELVRKRLNEQNDKGIVLLHGLPGTGKTTYLRHLVGEIKDKRVLFVSPSVAGNLMNPEFLDLLIENPNSVLVIEDAENIIMDRRYNGDSSVSNLLNLSDGLLSDCIKVQIICTFNNALSMVDSALMRKGRLIAKYEFGKLEANKAQALSDHLGFDSLIRQPMTVAEIANQHEMTFKKQEVEAIGFRRHEVVLS